ncbi:MULTISPECIES: ferredoxin [Streptomyces]|uniref:ferredoxin n=1 Tax=Streptomyces TaxID=1883 RepID=UPI0021A63C77|nr:MULTISPECIES: ferredoxin [Streptomyces]MCT2546687.1 ferredoxin [Streptomyces atratus]MCX5433862.1 ferredoxin [Streptomyces sp. NBC_00062]
MKIDIDQDKCVGAGQCVLVAPEVFDQRDEDGVAVLLTEDPPAQERGGVEEAARICPAAAIRVDGR